MSTIKLSPEQWSRVLEFLRSQPDLYVGQESDCKRFIEAIIWMSRSGASWRLLPSEYGKWNSVYKRFARWCEGGIWERMHQHFIDDPDMEYLIIDSTVVRAHHSAAGAPKKTVVKYLKPSVAAEVGSLQPGFPILGVFRLKGQSKRDGSIIVRSCKASLSPVYPIRDAFLAVNHVSCPSLSSSGPRQWGESALKTSRLPGALSLLAKSWLYPPSAWRRR